MRRWTWIVLAVLAIAWIAWSQHGAPAPAQDSQHPPTTEDAPTSALPPQVADTLALIRHGGPFPNRQDGVVFENRERELPRQPRGYYHEYTVETPGARDRGARRIITGGDPPNVYYYTDDHYRSFHTLEATR